MNTFDYPVTLETQTEGGFVVTFSDVPEAITQGEDEALLYAVDALESALSLYVNDRQSYYLRLAHQHLANTQYVHQLWNVPN